MPRASARRLIEMIESLDVDAPRQFLGDKLIATSIGGRAIITLQ